MNVFITQDKCDHSVVLYIYMFALILNLFDRYRLFVTK